MAIRDEFPEHVKRILCDSVGGLCSRPDCQAFTKGPHSSGEGVTNLGTACHIHAAAPGGPRYRADQTPEERKSAPNGIWLCQNHGKEVDNDEVRFPAELLRES